ncbi:MAG TPA: oligosaccharide flippase family protein [Candidatus Saccharimonadales bacterium]|nr:oligosaccharide flippase family protein [Candidatus Saccharimonadales bacterium]
MNLSQNLRGHWKKNTFLRNNIIVFFGSILTSAFSYFYYPIMARMLSIEEFGEIQTLVSLLTQASLIFGAINIVSVVLIASSKRNKHGERFIFELQKLTLYIAIGVSLTVAICSMWVTNFFHFPSVWPLLITLAAFIAGVPVVFWNSYLQARQNFTAMNAFGLVGAAGKLILAVFLVFLGWGAIGAALAVLLGQFAALTFARMRYDVPRLTELFKERLPNWKVLKVELRYTAMVIVVSLSITLLYSGDILLVKHYQSPEEAGAYAGIASIARIIFFLTLPFATVLLPAVHSEWKQREKTLKRSFTLVIGLGAFVAVVFWAFAPQIVSLMVGSRYIDYAYLLPELSLAILLMSIANILFYYMLSIRSIASLFISVIGVVTFFGLSTFNHSTSEQIVINMIGSSIVTVTLLVVTLSVWPRVSRVLTSKINLETKE